MINFCPKCGNKLTGDPFCANCGADLRRYLSDDLPEESSVDLGTASRLARQEAEKKCSAEQEEAAKKRAAEQARQEFLAQCDIENHVLLKYRGKQSVVEIPEGIIAIGKEAFRDCKSLTQVTIPNGVTVIGGNAFGWCTNLTQITIPNSVTEIGDWAFCGCKSLTQITIPNSVKRIGSEAFLGCTYLTQITIPSSVREIGAEAFLECTYLTKVTIPNSVIKIGGGAFGMCYALTIYCEAAKKPSGWDMFCWDDNCSVVWGYRG